MVYLVKFYKHPLKTTHSLSDAPVQLLESICLRDGEMELLPFHQERMNRSRRQLFGLKRQINLRKFFAEQSLPTQGYHKLRIVYDKGINAFTQEEYVPRTVRTLRVVELEPFDYRHKYLDRTELDAAFARRAGCDDIIMSWHTYITDTYYGNLALYDGQKWWTPVHPLLRGTRREKLCREGRLHATVIRVPDLKYFREVRIINAMLPLGESRPIRVKDVLLSE